MTNSREARGNRRTSESSPFAQLSAADDEQVFARARLAHSSSKLLAPQAWFRVANELIGAMRVLDPDIKRYWDALFAKLDDPNLEVPEPSMVTVHMMLAGFAIENLTKGFLVSKLTEDERRKVAGGKLPRSLQGNHAILDFVRRTGMTLRPTEEYLLARIGEAIWRGRYPIPTTHEKTVPFAQSGSDVRRINALITKLRRHVAA
jgi:hypothetical protein